MSDTEETAEVRAFPWYKSLAHTVMSRVRVVGTLAGVGALALLNAGPHFAGAAVLGTAATLAGLVFARGRPLGGPVILGASKEGLRWGDAFVPASELRQAAVGSQRRAHVLTVDRGLRVPLRFEVEGREHGRALIDALGLGLASQTHTLRTASSLTGRRALTVVLALVALFPLAVAGAAPTSGLAAALWLALLPAFGVLTFVSGRLVVGRDAITHRWLLLSRSALVGEIVRVQGYAATSTEPHRVVITLRDAPPMVVPISTADRSDAHAIEAVSRVVERIEHAMILRARQPSARFSEWWAERAAWPVSERLASLRPAPGTYRVGAFPFTEAELLTVLNHPQGPEDQRVAAAIALSAIPGTQTHLAQASKATALPRLVEAIDALLRHDERALARSLSPGPRVRVHVETIPLRDTFPIRDTTADSTSTSTSTSTEDAEEAQEAQESEEQAPAQRRLRRRTAG